MSSNNKLDCSKYYLKIKKKHRDCRNSKFKSKLLWQLYKE
jgi:hypothetical protein